MAFNPNILVCDGDSITLGTNVVWAGYPQIIQPQQLTRIFNIAVSSETLATMLANAPTNVDPLRGSGAHDTVIIWGGTNDINSGGTAAATYATLTSYVAARFAAGWPQVFVVTSIARNNGTNATLDAYNVLIRANTAGATAVIDVGANAHYNPAGSNVQNDTQYYVDGIHPTEFGQSTIVSPLILATLNSFNSPQNFDTNPQFFDDFTSYFTPGTGTYPAGDVIELHTANALWVANFTTPGKINAMDGGFQGAVNPFYSYQGFSPTADQWARVIIGNPTFRGGPAVRVATSAATGYMCRPEAANTVALYKCIAGTFTVLQNGVSATFKNGDELVLTAVGTTISVYQNGNLLIQKTDSSIASGFGGIFVGGSGGASPSLPQNAQQNASGVSIALDNYPPRAATPIISPNGGSFTSPKVITLSTSAVGVSIYYTTDGSTPTASSTLYSAPFTLNSSATIKAIAIGANYANSSVASASFSIPAGGFDFDLRYRF